jgi:protein-tyrosine phosphatase
MRLLVVCLGNICRSPMAEGALRARLGEAGLAHVAVDSAGTGDWHVGAPPDPRAIACARRHGVDISEQRARQISATDFHAHDWLLCADASVLHDVHRRAPEGASARSVLLLDWAWPDGGPADLPGDPCRLDLADPYTGDHAAFERVWRRIDAAASEVARRLSRAADRGGA